MGACMRTRYALAIAVAGFALAACGSSSSSTTANTPSYTITPKGALHEQLYVTFSGPRAAFQRVMRAFESARKGGYTVGFASGQTDCDIPADGGKVTISVITVVGVDNSVGPAVCNSIRNRF